MRAENKEWIEANKGHWELYKNDQILRNGFDAERAFKIIREEFNPHALFCVWCKEDIANILKYLYTQYEKKEKA